MIRFSKRTGLPASYQDHGVERLVEPMRWNFWRVLTDNDLGWKVDKKSEAWKSAGEKLEVTRMETSHDTKGRLTIEVEALISDPPARIGIRHTVAKGGILRTHASFEFTGRTVDPGPPRLGLRFAIPGAFDRIFWYGRGPH